MSVTDQNMERRFVCEICNAALKRKDHLTRHKQSHNPERPYLCHCLKAFKRKEQLSLHAVIHSGHKKHSCVECGKGFYRKDHLRKHTRSHIARRLKAGELNDYWCSSISNFYYVFQSSANNKAASRTQVHNRIRMPSSKFNFCNKFRDINRTTVKCIFLQEHFHLLQISQPKHIS